RRPSPLGVHRPERDGGKDDDGRAAGEAFDVLLEPFELLGPQRAEAPRFEVDHVHQADEVDTVMVEAVPPGALRPLAEALQVALAIVLEHVVFAWDVEDGDG